LIKKASFVQVMLLVRQMDHTATQTVREIAPHSDKRRAVLVICCDQCRANVERATE
jgi:hypothetical protein